MRTEDLETTLRATRRNLAELEAARQEAELQREESRLLYAQAAAVAVPPHALTGRFSRGSSMCRNIGSRSQLMNRFGGLARMCDLNSASVDDIAKLDGVSVAQAYDLVLWRPYPDWLAVEAVPGFDETSVVALQQAGATLETARDHREPL